MDLIIDLWNKFSVFIILPVAIGIVISLINEYREKKRPVCITVKFLVEIKILLEEIKKVVEEIYEMHNEFEEKPDGSKRLKWMFPSNLEKTFKGIDGMLRTLIRSMNQKQRGD